MSRDDPGHRTGAATLKTSCAELPVAAVIRACRATLQAIRDRRDSERREIIERHRWTRPLFGAPVRLSDAQAERRARTASHRLELLERLAFREQEERVSALLALAEATPETTMFVARADFADIRAHYDPSTLTHAPAQA
jgi:hypothetical protein